MSTKRVYEIGEMPPIGRVPAEMYAQVVRADRFGEPRNAFKVEKVPVPSLKADEVLVYVMAAGVNYNNVWASLGVPLNVIAVRQKSGFDASDLHIGGSDASGVVYAVGDDVRSVKVGDQVVIHGGWWERDCPVVASGGDPVCSPTFKIWGYETGWGSFGQFCKAQEHQCLPKPPRLTWEAAAAYMLVSCTAYRMLRGWAPHTVRPGDVVLVWGGAGGLGCQGIQIAKHFGAIPVAVVSDPGKFDFCFRLGAKGCINRTDFTHWGLLPHWKDTAAYNQWAAGARAFGKALWDAVGERKNPRIVLEHPGEDTIPTSIFACDTGGMVVICAGTTGYNGVVDLRYLWMRQKRYPGSHLSDAEPATAPHDLVAAGVVDPCLSETFSFDEIPRAHQLMHENRHPPGNMACLVGAPRAGLTSL